MRLSGFRAQTGAIVVLAWVVAAVPLARGAVRHDVVAPPGATGCERQPTLSDDYPSARLPATMRYRARSARVYGRLDHPTQATRSTVHAYLPGGRRVDVATTREYTCTVPGASGDIGFRVDHHTFGGLLRRHATLRVAIAMRMVNGKGRRTTLTRRVIVRPE